MTKTSGRPDRTATPQGIVMVDGGGAEISEETLARCLTDYGVPGARIQAVSKLRINVVEQSEKCRYRRIPQVIRRTQRCHFKALGLQNLRDRTQSLQHLRAQRALNAHGGEQRFDASEFDQLVRSETRKRILSGKRLDGRGAKTIRPIECKTDLQDLTVHALYPWPYPSLSFDDHWRFKRCTRC